MIQNDLKTDFPDLPDDWDSLKGPANGRVNKDGVAIIDSSWNEIPDEAFKNNFDIETVVLPWGITEIGVSAFENCINLKNVDIPNSLSKIASRAFANCYNLFHINIRASELLKTIAPDAFFGCYSTTNNLQSSDANSIAPLLLSSAAVSLLTTTRTRFGQSANNFCPACFNVPLNQMFIKS